MPRGCSLAAMLLLVLVLCATSAAAAVQDTFADSSASHGDVGEPGAWQQARRRMLTTQAVDPQAAAGLKQCAASVARQQAVLQQACAARVQTSTCARLHGQACSRCTYNGGKVGVKESKCTAVSDTVKYTLVAGVIVPGPGYEWSATKGIASGCRAGFFKPAAGAVKCTSCSTVAGGRAYQPLTAQRSFLSCRAGYTINTARTSCTTPPPPPAKPPPRSPPPSPPKPPPRPPSSPPPTPPPPPCTLSRVPAKPCPMGQGAPMSAAALQANPGEDCILDIAVVYYDSNEVIICHGNGDGTFSYDGTRKSIPGDPYTVTALDFNHDGIQDLAVGTAGSLVYMLPGGLAAFAPSVNDIDINTMEQLLPNSASTRLYVASGDTQLNVFNISGQTLQALAPVPLPGGQGADALALSPDEKWLAASSAYANLVSVHPVDPATGAAGQAVATVACNQTYGVAFTKDGAHIVVTSRADDVVRVYTFDASTGALGTTATREFAAHHNPASIVTADFNEDGIVDYLVQLNGDAAIAVLLGDADGPATISTSLTSCGGSYQLVAADFNHDNHIDILNVCGDVHTLLHLGAGDGTFGAGVSIN